MAAGGPLQRTADRRIVTKWTLSAPILEVSSSRCAIVCKRTPSRSSCRSRRGRFPGIIDLIETCLDLQRRSGQRISRCRIFLTRQSTKRKNCALNSSRRSQKLDEDLMMKYLEGEEITVPELKGRLRKGVVQRSDHPGPLWLFYRNKGVQARAGRRHRISAVTG